MAQICALFALVQPVLQQVSCSNGTLTNTPKHYETHKNMSLGSNGVDRVRSLRKIPMNFMAQICALIAPVQPILHQVLCSNERLPNAPKHYETDRNKSLGSTWLDRVCSLRKIPRRLHGTCALIAPVQPILHQVLCSNERLPNAPKHYETHQNMSFGSNGVDRVRSLRIILMQLRGNNFCINCASSTRFVSSFVQ